MQIFCKFCGTGSKISKVQPKIILFELAINSFNTCNTWTMKCLIGYNLCSFPPLNFPSIYRRGAFNNYNVKKREGNKEYKEEGQCAQKGGRMLIFVICGFIKTFLTNSYFILHVHQVKGFKMRHYRYLYFNFSIRYS